jgi:putative membrane protein
VTFKLTKEEKDKIHQTIILQESKTDAEIVPVILHSAHHYIWANYLLGIILGIVFYLILYFSPYNHKSPLIYLMFFSLGFTLGFTLCLIPKIKKYFLLKKEIDYAISLKSNEVFLHYNLHRTKNHQGVLILISLFERKIKIMRDFGVNEKIPEIEFEKIISSFGKNFQENGICNALLKSIEMTGEVLAKEIPKTNQKHNNELPDEIIIE